ncbi:MAG: hypothetical protein ABGY10_03905 [bacterium]
MLNDSDPQWETIGCIYVDAGLCWLGDPCYVLGDEASSRVKDWGEFVDALHEGSGTSAPLGEGVGVAVSTGWGDGKYPVEVKRRAGRVAEVRIVFIAEGEE